MRAPRAPKMKPRGPQNASKTMFGSKMMIFQKSICRPRKINIFGGGRVNGELKIDPKKLQERIKRAIIKYYKVLELKLRSNQAG